MNFRFQGESGHDLLRGRYSLSRSLLGVERTFLFASHMSAFDPKRTWNSLLINSNPVSK